MYNGFILHAHPVRGESHNQCNTTGEVATVNSLHLLQRAEVVDEENTNTFKHYDVLQH